MRVMHSSYCEYSRKGAIQFTVSIKELAARGDIQENRKEELVSIRCMDSQRGEGTRFHRITGRREGIEKDRADGRSRWIPAGK